MSYPPGDVCDREGLGRVDGEKRPDTRRAQLVGRLLDAGQSLAVGWAMSEGAQASAMALDRDHARTPASDLDGTCRRPCAKETGRASRTFSPAVSNEPDDAEESPTAAGDAGRLLG